MYVGSRTTSAGPEGACLDGASMFWRHLGPGWIFSFVHWVGGLTFGALVGRRQDLESLAVEPIRVVVNTR
jgi:hypothetical protein